MSVLEIEDRGFVRQLTLNRPEVRNAVNLELTLAMSEALDAADSDDQVRCVVVTGAGDRAFCAGADLTALARGESPYLDDARRAAHGFAGYVRHPISKPIIAAVNGFALGGGTELALASDIVIAADHAEFGLPEVTRGLVAGAGGAFRLVHQLPTKLAMELLLTGMPISAARALDLGLVNHTVPLADLLPTAWGLAERISANAPLAVRASKRMALGLSDGVVPAEAPFWESTAREVAMVMASSDLREGATAFAQKREPRWTGQ